MAGDSQKRNAFPWLTTKMAIADGNESVPNYSLFKFSAACYYFAEALTDIIRSENDTVVPLGLIEEVTVHFL
jgi:hypothetical protein